MSREVFSELHEAAIEYARNGFPVFPCVPNGKAPACANGFRDATLDESQIDEWWSKMPMANIGTEPERTGHCVLDVEATGLEAWDGIQANNGHVRTFANSTPRGGRHFWFRGSLPPRVRLFNGYDIDTRGRASYVLLPPSIVAGKLYETVDDADIAPLPDYIAQLAVQRKHDIQAAAIGQELDLPANVERALSHVKSAVARGKAPGQGSRDNDTFIMACELKDLGLTPHTVLELIEDWWNPECKPPQEHDDIERIVGSAFVNGQNAPGAYAVGKVHEVFATLVANAPAIVEKPAYYALADDDGMDAVGDAEFLFDTVLPRRGTVLVYGPSQQYKSFLMLDLALAIATGLDGWGLKPSRTGPVVYSALEGREGIMRDRRPAWRLARGVTGKTKFYVNRAPMLRMQDYEEYIGAIKERLGNEKPVAIFFETAAKMLAGLDPTRDVPQLIVFCEQLADHFDCVVVMSHHSGHDADKGPKDSSTYGQGFDTVIQVSKVGHLVCEATIKKHKDAAEPDKPFTFQGQEVGKSLVFQRTTLEQHKALTKREDHFAGPKVGAALKAVNARGLENAVSTASLALELVPAVENETLEERDSALRSASVKLNRLGKTVLEAYCTKAKGQTLWHLPD